MIFRLLRRSSYLDQEPTSQIQVWSRKKQPTFLLEKDTKKTLLNQSVNWDQVFIIRILKRLKLEESLARVEEMPILFKGRGKKFQDREFTRLIKVLLFWVPILVVLLFRRTIIKWTTSTKTCPILVSMIQTLVWSNQDLSPANFQVQTECLIKQHKDQVLVNMNQVSVRFLKEIQPPKSKRITIRKERLKVQVCLVLVTMRPTNQPLIKLPSLWE